MPDTLADPTRTSVLFVCLGNICRSPLAEGIFRHLVHEGGIEERFHIDSAGTGSWHVGEPPDSRMSATSARRGVHLDSAARQVLPEDLDTFDIVVAMDRDNLRTLESMARRADADARLHLLREFDPEAGGDHEVPDPYYGGQAGFEAVYDMVYRSCSELLDVLSAEQEPG